MIRLYGLFSSTTSTTWSGRGIASAGMVFSVVAAITVESLAMHWHPSADTSAITDKQATFSLRSCADIYRFRDHIVQQSTNAVMQ